MSAVAKAVKSVAGAVVDVVEAVGGAVVDVVDFVVDDIVAPVVKVVGNVIDSALDDPIKTIAQIAAIATNNTWALPLIEGADVAIAGGDLSDILESTAKAYVAQEIGSAVGSKVGNSIYANQAGVQAGVQTANEAIAAEVIGRASGSAAAAIVTKQDPLKAFVAGGVSAGVPAVLGKVDGFTDLPKSAQSAISQAVTATALGRKIDATAIASMVAAAEVTTRALEAYDPKGTKLTSAERALAADVLMATTSTALQGGNVSAAIQTQLVKAGTKQLGEMVKSGFKDVVAKVQKTYENADQNAMLITKNEADQKAIIDKYNAEKAKLDEKITEQNRLKKIAEDKVAIAKKDTTNKANVDAANKATKAYNDYAKTVGDAYNKAKPILDGYSKDLSKLQVTHAEMTNDYEDLIESLSKSTSPLQDKLDDVYSNTNEAFVKVLDPKFNAAEYKKINGLGADVDAYEHYLDKGMTKGLKTNNAAAAADIQGEKARLAYDLAEAKGINPSQITDTDIKNLYTAIDKKYGTNVNALKAASIKDLLTGNYKTYDDLLKDSKQNKFKVDVSGQAYGEWNKPKDFTPAEGTRLATLAEMDSGAGVLVYSDDGEPVWVTPVGVEEWDYTTGTRVTKKSESISKSPTLEQLQFDDPEAALQTLGSMEKNAKGGLDKFATTMANSMVLAAYASGNKAFGDKVKQTLSIVSQGVGEQVSSLASFIATQTGMGYNNALIKAGTALQEWGAANQSESTKKQEQNIIDAAKNAKGFVGTISALATAIKNNPGGFGTFIAKEGIQEILPLGVAKWVSKFGTLAAYGGNAAMEFAESYGGNAKDTYDQAKKLGLSEAEAQKKAEIVGLQAGVVTLLTAGIGDVPLVKTVISGLGKDVATRHFTGAAAEAASEFFDESLGNAAQQYQLTGKVNWSTAWTSGAIGSAIGAGTTGSIMAGYSIADSAVVGRDAAGKNVTLGQFLEGTAVPTTINYNATVGVNKDGIKITLGDIGAAAKDTDLAPIFDITLDSAPPTFRTAVDDATAMDADEARAFLISQGYTNPTAKEIKLFTDAGVTEAEARNNAYVWADPKVTSVDEARDMLIAAGYKNPTAAEIKSLSGKIDETKAKTNVTTYVDQHTVTAAEVKAAFEAEGYKPTTKQINAFVKSGATVNQDKIIADITKQADAGAVSEAEARSAYEALGLKKPTEADIKALMGQYDESQLSGKAEANLDNARYNSIMAQLDELTVGASQETLDAIELVKADLTKQVTDLGFKIDKTAEDLTGAIGDVETNVLAKIAENEAAGLTRDEATQKAIADVAADLGTTTEAISAQIGAPASVDAEGNPVAATGIYAELADISTDVQTKYDSLTDGQKDLADALVAQGETLNAAIETAAKATAEQIGAPASVDAEGNPVAATGIYAELADISTDVQAKYDALTDDQKALADQLTQQGVDLNTAIDTAKTELSGQITDLSTDVQAKYDALTDNQKALADQLTQQGVDLNTAIDTAKTELSGQITDLSTDVQAKYDSLTDNQKALADQLTQQGVDLNTAIDTVKADLTTAIGESETRVTKEVQAVADLVGKPASEVTQGDIDYVKQFLQGQQTDPNIQADLSYDVNQDGIINQSDLDILNNVVTNPDPQWLAPTGSKWAATGIYGTLAENQAAAQKAIADEAERTRAANAAIASANRNAAAQQAQRTQRMGNINNMMGMLMQAGDIGGQTVTTKQVDPAKIGYVYDWSSIFANPTQQKMFTSPFGSYAEGGMVEDDVNAELIKMLRS